MSLEKWMIVVINKPQQQTLGREENLLSRVIISKCSLFDQKKNHRVYKETVKYGPFKGKR